MSLICFEIPGQPVAKGRARAYRRGNHIAHYTPKKTANYESLVKLSAAQAMKGKELIDGPVKLTVTLLFQIPASWSKVKQAAAAQDEIRPTVKPDCSNILKAIEDSLNGIVWQDDKQVVELTVSKYYSNMPGAYVSITEISSKEKAA